MNLLSRSCLFGAALLALAFPVSASAKASIGEPAPSFTLTDLEGEEHRLSEYRGKTVVLEWVNPECPFVVRHYSTGNIPQMQGGAVQDQVIWLTINSAAEGKQGDYTEQQAKEWLGKHYAVPTAYLRDPKGEVGRKYGAKTTPHMFVINPEGVLIYDGAIDDSPRGSRDAENYVTAALEAARDGELPPKPKTEPYGCTVKY